jgi:hypothetical protein
LWPWDLTFLTFEYDLCTHVRDSQSKVCSIFQYLHYNVFFLLASFNGVNHFYVRYHRFDRWIYCRSLTVIRLLLTILIAIAIRKNSPGNSFASCSFVYLRFDLCFWRNNFRVCPGTLLSKYRRTAVVAIFWHSKYKRRKLFSSFDSESASSVNKIQLNHTNFVFINVKFINISEIK